MKEDIILKLKRLAKESEKELRNIGLGHKIKKNITYEVNYRAKKRLGQCCNKKEINISSWLLEIANDHDIKNTIIHEILHTFDDTKGHKVKWQYYANYVNNRTDYEITRLTNVYRIYNNVGITRPMEYRPYKWEITCTKCGQVWNWYRLTQKGLNDFMKEKRVHRKCGGKDFKIVDLDEGELIW